MYPQISWTWSQGRQTLAIGTHNLAQINGNENLFSQIWSDNDAKENMLQDSNGIFDLHV